MTGWVALAAFAWIAAETARRFETRLSPPGAALERAIRIQVIAFALIVVCMLSLGALARLTAPGVLALEAALLVSAVALTRFGVPESGRPDDRRDALPELPAMPIAIVGALLAFAIAFAAVHAPLTLYDSLSYHLFFAARWVQDHAITIIPTPFSDEAQAYAPGNGELFLAWLMLPLHSDALARMGQFPFGVLGATTLFGLARRLGAAPARAIYPAAFFLLSRPVVEQMMGSDVDLICAALFLTTVYFTVHAVDLDRRTDWALAGTSFGLFLGTKYLALVFAPALILFSLARGFHRRIIWAIPFAVLFAIPWYARNWIVAGSPIYPASLSVAGVTIARGAYDRSAMLNTVFHTTDVRLFPAMVARAFGPTLAVLWLPSALIGWCAMARRGWWPHAALVLLPITMVPLYWYGLPVNIDARFLMPAVAPALLPLAFVFPSRSSWNAAVHTTFVAGMIWLIVGFPASIPMAVPWYMNGWLSLGGLVRPAYLTWFAATAAALAIAWRLARHTRQFALPLATLLLLCTTAGLAAAAERVRLTSGELLDVTWPYIRSDYIDAWRWLDDHVHEATVAYTGINLPYPLAGDRLTNRVVYVAIDGRHRWKFHDYDRAYRSGRFDPHPPLLATSSGELKPVVARTGPREDAVRPRYERMQGDCDAWIFGLETTKVRYVFVAALSMYEVDYVWHNDAGFPIEDDWASERPAQFQLVFTNPRVHIYELGRETRS